jgi:hypothetical protein
VGRGKRLPERLQRFLVIGPSVAGGGVVLQKGKVDERELMPFAAENIECRLTAVGDAILKACPRQPRITSPRPDFSMRPEWISL